MDRLDLFIPIDAIDHTRSFADVVRAQALRAIGLAEHDEVEVRVLRRALDARKGRPLGYRVRIEVKRGPADGIADAADGRATDDSDARRPVPPWPTGRARPRVVVVGSGPAGAWAALRLAEAGVEVSVLERGKPVQPRRRDLAALQRGELNPESNYCFGEGGAGTYSDGKLYTRAKNRGAVAAVLADLERFGAPADIAIEARPHVGSNRLPKVLTALRAHLEARGVTYHFETAFSGLVLARGRLRAVRLVGGGELPADAVVLAVGHSARPVYRWAAESGVAIERKPIAVGVRMEHPQPVINRMQYGRAAEHPALPAAFYELKTQAAGRGVYSFCMCPGGWIVPAATEPGAVVVNGMSLSKRDSPFANSGLVVSIEAGDMGPAAAGVLAGMELQGQIEQRAFAAGGGGFAAPAIDLESFLANRSARTSLGPVSYRPGITPADLGAIFPPFVTEALREGLEALCHRHHVLRDERALLVAAETRTSAPVRLLRDPVSLQSPSTVGLFPAGEGAGYAGGIVSAALDGLRVADALLAWAAATPAMA